MLYMKIPIHLYCKLHAQEYSLSFLCLSHEKINRFSEKVGLEGISEKSSNGNPLPQAKNIFQGFKIHILIVIY